MSGDRDKSKESEGWILAEGGVVQSASGSRYTTSHNLPWHEAGNSVRVGGFIEYFRCMREGDGLQGRGEAPGAVVAAGGSRKIDEGHVRRDFGSSKGAAVTGIRQAWRGQGR